MRLRGGGEGGWNGARWLDGPWRNMEDDTSMGQGGGEGGWNEVDDAATEGGDGVDALPELAMGIVLGLGLRDGDGGGHGCGGGRAPSSVYPE